MAADRIQKAIGTAFVTAALDVAGLSHLILPFAPTMSR